MKLRKGFVLREVCGEKVLVGEGLDALDFGKMISLNRTAAFLWEKASEMGDFTAEDLASALCERYDIDSAQALQDTTEIILQWQEMGLAE